jgi:predicted HicB family RNase H-like nuclease
MMEYKGYLARVQFDDRADLFHGEVMNIRDVVTFQGRTVRGLQRAFRDSVEDYLAFCAERGEEPERPFSGKFVVRISPELHREISIAAAKDGKSLNAWVAERLSSELSRKGAAQ